MKPEKRLFAFSILYLFALFGALVARPMAASHDRSADEDEIRRRQQSRAIIMALLLGAFVGAGLCDHHRQDGRSMTTLARRNGRTAAARRPARRWR